MRPKSYPEPFQLLVVTALAVFLGEMLVMFLLQFLPELSVTVEAAVDALLLSTLAAPVLYSCLFRPMRNHIRERAKVEAALLEAKGELEERVAARTAELASAVESLRNEVEERTRAQEELQKTNRFIRSVVEAAPFLLMIYELDTVRCVFANGRLEECLGYPPEEAYLQGGSFFKRILAPEDHAAFVEWNDRLSQGESAEETNRRLVLREASGQLRSCNVSLSVMSRSEEGAPKEMLLVAMECTEEPSGGSPESPPPGSQ